MKPTHSRNAQLISLGNRSTPTAPRIDGYSLIGIFHSGGDLRIPEGQALALYVDGNMDHPWVYESAVPFDTEPGAFFLLKSLPADSYPEVIFDVMGGAPLQSSPKHTDEGEPVYRTVEKSTPQNPKGDALYVSRVGGPPVHNADYYQPTGGPWHYGLHLGADVLESTFGDAASLHVWFGDGRAFLKIDSA